MARAPKVCAHPGCAAFQPCDEHATAKWASSTRRAQLPQGWHRIQARIKRRDPICTICHLNLTTEVHHVGDKHDHSDANLAGTCRGCHARLTQQQAAAGRMYGN